MPDSGNSFTVTIPGTQAITVAWALNVAPILTQGTYNSSTVAGNTTFNFKGKFSDYNNKQTFRVYYNNALGTQVFYDFTFKKVKSLLTSSAYSVIFPNPPSINPERCKILSSNISFTNIPYSNPWEMPAISYGTVTTYEYLLPTGWSMNSTTSTGSNWITGTNNVTVTTDLSNGNGGQIQIRAVNSCATGLQKGEIYNIPVSRPAPDLYLSGIGYICSLANNLYSITNLPAGATVAWTVSPATGLVTLTQSSNQATVKRVTGANGTATLTASITDACGNNDILSKTISVANNLFQNSSYNYDGQQLPMQYLINSNYNNVCNLVTTTATIESNIGAPITWSKISSSQVVNWVQSGNSITFYLYSIGATAVFQATSSCGLSTQFAFKSVDCPDGGCNPSFTFFPNPMTSGKGKIIIHPNILPPNCIMGGSGGGQNEIRIFDNQGTLRASKTFLRGTKETSIDVSNFNPGIYNIQVSDGKKFVSKILIIN